jgi:hypothetical protein
MHDSCIFKAAAQHSTRKIISHAGLSISRDALGIQRIEAQEANKRFECLPVDGLV